VLNSVHAFIFPAIIKCLYADSYKASLVIVTSVMIPIILVIIIIVIFGWRKIKQQRKELRRLTETEVKEFVDGNPKSLKSGEFFDGACLIDSLPYDKEKYEIPMDNLHIGKFMIPGFYKSCSRKSWYLIFYPDQSQLLGSGAFGEVFLGQIEGVETGTGSLALYVAIKRVKPDVDVVYFKALLSEIKIMGFLGSHRNVVSLIGANTGNIRNSEWIKHNFK